MKYGKHIFLILFSIFCVHSSLSAQMINHVSKKKFQYQEEIFKYLDILSNNGILNKSKIIEFKDQVNIVFGEKVKKKKVSVRELIKKKKIGIKELSRGLDVNKKSKKRLS